MGRRQIEIKIISELIQDRIGITIRCRRPPVSRLHADCPFSLGVIAGERRAA
jgi:hypothetical protein